MCCFCSLAKALLRGERFSHSKSCMFLGTLNFNVKFGLGKAKGGHIGGKKQEMAFVQVDFGLPRTFSRRCRPPPQ